MSDIIFNDQNEVIDLKNKNKADFKSLAKNNKLSEKFILENTDFLDWSIISENQALTIDIMVKCAKKIKWVKLPINPHIPTDALVLGKYKGNIDKMAEKEAVSEAFLTAYANEINWVYVFNNDRKDEAFLRKIVPLLDKIDAKKQQIAWKHLSRYQTVSEKFLRDFEDKIVFEVVGDVKGKHVLSTQFVEDFKYVLDPEYITKTQKSNLDKAFLKDYKDFNVRDFYRNATENWIENFLTTNKSSRLDWKMMSNASLVSEEFMMKYKDKLYFHFVATKNKFSEEFMRKLIKIVPKNTLNPIFEVQSFSEKFLEEHLDLVDLGEISESPTIKNLSEKFIKKHQDKWDWYKMLHKTRFNEAFLREMTHSFGADTHTWDSAIVNGQRVSVAFLKEFAHNFNDYGWNYIPECQILTEDFIREFEKKIHWRQTSQYQILSENFIREFQTKVNWDNISQHQVLSEAFIREFDKKVNWYNISVYQDVSEAFKKEFAKKTDNKFVLNDVEMMEHFNQKACKLFAHANNDKKQIEKALILGEKALSHKKNDEITYIDDNQMYYLLALDRKEEAYLFVKNAQQKYPQSNYLTDFRYDLDYLDWLKRNR